jgi:hypothetical protein
MRSLIVSALALLLFSSETSAHKSFDWVKKGLSDCWQNCLADTSEGCSSSKCRLNTVARSYRSPLIHARRHMRRFTEQWLPFLGDTQHGPAVRCRRLDPRDEIPLPAAVVLRRCRQRHTRRHHKQCLCCCDRNRDRNHAAHDSQSRTL